MIGFANPDLHGIIQNVTGTSGETHASTMKEGVCRRITGHRYLEVGLSGLRATASDSDSTSADWC
jgi:hypothetical protein